MASVNAINTKTDLTVQIFDRVFGSKEAAGNFTVSVFRISHQTGIPVMTLLQQFQGQTAPEITVSLAYYLNGIRSSSTLLGVNVPTQPNYYVSRNIRI